MDCVIGLVQIKIDVRAFGKDKLGNLNLIYLNPGCSASVKLLFRKKVFNLD